MRLGHPRLALALLVLGGAACSRSEPSDVEVEVRSVGLDSVSHSPVVVLQDKDRRVALPIWIGASEAQAIAMQLEGVSPPRPMTHDLMRNLLVQSGVEMQRVVIASLEDRTYLARIHLSNGSKDVEVDSRPSDAIALAVRFKKPIFVARALMSGETAIDIQQAFGSDTIELRGVTVQGMSAELAELLDLESARGVLVSGVGPRITTLQRGDVILAVNGREIDNLSSFGDAMRAVGENRAELDIVRQGSRLEVELD